jgi:hypothetical protein
MKNVKISQVSENMKIIRENTPVNVRLARNLYFIRKLSQEMDTFVNRCKTILYYEQN